LIFKNENPEQNKRKYRTALVGIGILLGAVLAGTI
jgi:hypothetical protein